MLPATLTQIIVPCVAHFRVLFAAEQMENGTQFRSFSRNIPISIGTASSWPACIAFIHRSFNVGGLFCSMNFTEQMENGTQFRSFSRNRVPASSQPRLSLPTMNIGFDAKRAFHNGTGLGHYSRTLIRLLADQFPEHQYYLFNPKRSSKFQLARPNLHEVVPKQFLHSLFSSAWRSSWVKRDLKKNNINLYHGLSHEIPIGIQNTGIKSVVTIHDLIHERFPEQYNSIDVKIYSKKFRYACNHADKVIAISEQTKRDIIDFYKIPEEKIVVCYQSCHPAFAVQATAEEKKRVAKKYNLPAQFFLYVGSIIERKNLLNICKAVFLLRNELDVPLVVVGDGGKYKQQVKDFIIQHNLLNKIIFLSESEAVKSDPEIRSPSVFATIYQLAIAMIYPSFFEGFGAPVLEALWSRLPVITSNVSCLPEAGGDGAYYVNPSQAEEIAEGMRKIYQDKELVATMIEKGWQHALKSSPEKYAANMMNIYKSVV
jgi:glycosyltransferase involved in cell wall biosynthesis